MLEVQSDRAPAARCFVQDVTFWKLHALCSGIGSVLRGLQQAARKISLIELRFYSRKLHS